MGIRNKDGALFMATGVDNSGLYAGRREAIGIIKAMSSQITSFDVFGGLGISAATAFASAAKSSYDFEKEFRKNMLEVATISTQVTNDMTGFMNQVMAITQEIPIKAPDAAKALYQIVSAGHDGAAGMNVLEVSARSAIGGMTDTATAADAITTLLNAYKLSADDAEKVSDQLFTTARLGKTTFGELGQSIAQVAPIAAAYGVEMDQVLAAVATLTKSGTPTAQAMTQIRASIIAASKELGDGAFNTYTFQEALAEVANRAGGSESKLRELIPEVEAVNGVLGMTGIKAQDAADHLNAMNDSAGATSAAFELMMNDVDKQMTLLSNNIQAALRPMGQAILKEVSDVAKSVNEAFENGDAKEAMKSLGDLIVIVTGAFIGYKGAVIASTTVQNIHTKALVVSRLASIQHTTSTKLLTNAIKAQTVAMLKNIAALATNPYVLAAAAIAALGYGIYKYATQASVAEKAQMRFNVRIEEQKRMAEEHKEKTDQLLDTIKDEIKTDYERNKALKILKDLYPQIFEKYDIETLKLADILEIKKQIAEIDGQRSYQSDKSHFAGLVSKRDKLNDEISYRSENYGNGQYKYGEFYGKTVNQLKKEREGIQHEIDLMYSGLKEQAEEIWNKITPKEIKVISLESNIKTLKEEQDKLNKLVNGNQGPILNNDSYNPIPYIPSPQNIARLTIVNDLINEQTKELGILRQQTEENVQTEDTVFQRKIQLTKELADAKSNLNKLRAPSSKAKESEITAAEDEVKKITTKLETLTGVSIKEGDKLKQTQTELARSILDSELKLQAGRIAAMEDGKAKRMALAKQEYDEARAQIDKEEQDLLSKKGITKDQKKIVSDNANSLRLQEQQNLLKKNTDIEKSSAKEIQSIWADVNSRFSSGLENRLTEIDKFYEEAIKKAREEGVEEIKIAELISKAKEEKASVKNESFIEEGMQRIAMEEEVAQKHLEIKQDQFVTDSLYQLKRNSLERKFTLDRLNLLKKSIAQEGTERYRQIEDEKKQLSGHLTYLDEYGETLKSEVIQDALSGLSDITDAIGGLNDDLGETMQQVQQLIGAVAQLASGNYIGAAVSVITSVVSSIAKHNADVVAYNKNIEAGYWDAVNWKIERQIQLMKELDGINSDQVGQSIDEQINELMDKLSGVDLNVKMGNLQAFFDNVGNGISSANKKGNEFAVNFLKGLFDAFEDDNKSGVNGHWNFRFYDILKDLSKDEIISLQGIPEIWAILPEEIQNYIKQLSDAVDKQKELTETTKEMFTGTTEDDIVQSILDAMSRGKDGVDDLTTYFKDMMKKAMLEGVKMNYLQKPIKDFYKQFSAMSESDGMLTEGEIKQLEGLYQQIIDNAQAQFDNLQKISGLDFSTPEEGESDNTLKGAYAKASQESIDLLAGQTGASRVVLEDIRNNMQPIREQMKLIYDMQVRGWEDVKAIRDLSDKVEKNTNRIAENTQEIKTVADKISDNTKRTVETLEGTIDVKVKM